MSLIAFSVLDVFIRVLFYIDVCYKFNRTYSIRHLYDMYRISCIYFNKKFLTYIS